MPAKIVLITGASSGIGRACVQKFDREGYHVVFCGRRKNLLAELSNELQNPHFYETCDVQNPKSVKNFLESIPEAFQPVDILINNAGLARGKTSFEDSLVSDWEEMIDTNIKGLLYVSKTIAQSMKQQQSGHIINIGSIAGKETYPNGHVYCATKKAVDALTQGMRIDLLPYHIKVTGICPGAVNTEFSTVRFHGDVQKAESVYNGFQPLLAEDIADTVFYCAQLPQHVCINDLTIMPTAQASATLFHKS